MKLRAVRTRIFREGESLEKFLDTHLRRVRNGSVVVVTSKIVALAERRVADAKEKKRLIEKESSWVLKTKYGMLTLKDGILMWNAGIDTSNADGKLVLLPEDSFAAAEHIRAHLARRHRVKQLGVIVSDSRIMPLRAGVVGIALGYAGFKGIKDYRGKKDIFGDTYRVTRTDVADSLATAAVLLMGEGKERQPIAIIEEAPVEFTGKRPSRTELLVRVEDDMYRPLWGSMGT